ncbi:MAG TPA: hypothetical protein ENH35_00965 [Candidatus Moranbacteria bacterium]|nr:hypothetical protein [Candidatus Moranbacteria bacterium]
MKKALAIKTEIIEEIKNLPVQHQKKILDIVRLLKTGLQASHKKHSITELRGCGKRIWKGIDAQKYVNKLRSEWN